MTDIRPPDEARRQAAERLLADARAATPRQRLAQAADRADLLLRLSRTLAAVQHPERLLEATVDTLVDELVDVAQLVVRTGLHQVTTARVLGGEPRVHRSRTNEQPAVDLDGLVHRAAVEVVALPPSDPASSAARTAALAGLLPDVDLARRAEALGLGELLVLPLQARGRCFGLLVLGRAGATVPGDEARPFLDDLAARVSTAVDAALVVAESRHVAAVLRRSLLPPSLPVLPGGLDVAAHHRVAEEHAAVGGDFYDVVVDGDDVLLALGDVTGKGVEAAVKARRVRNAVRTATLVDPSPGAVLGLVNRVLVTEGDDDDLLCTAVYARARRREDGEPGLVVELGTAGHPPALVLRADGRVEAVPEHDRSHGPVLGLVLDAEHPTSTVELAPGDALMVYTDGVVEAGAPGPELGWGGLARAVHPLAGAPASALVEAAALRVSTHLGDAPHDDVALVALRVPPVRP